MATSGSMDRLIPQKVVRYLLGDISDMTMWRRIRCGVIPEPTKQGRMNYWRESQIKALIESGPQKPAAA